MADEVTEKPTLDGPTPDDTGTELTPEAKAVKMLEQLSSLGIKDENHLAGIVETAQKFGPQAQELGELRTLINDLKQENQAMKSPQPTPDLDDYTGQENVDLGKLVYENQYKATKDFYTKEIIQPQRKLQAKYFHELNEVKGDEDYKLVEETFNKHLNSPQVQSMIANGATSVTKEYDKTLRITYRNYLKQSKDALQGLVTPGEIKVPHVEGQTQQPVMPTTDDEKKENIEKTIKARKAGDLDSNQALEALVKESLSPDPKDPFFQHG